jgi:hypothetical protein
VTIPILPLPDSSTQHVDDNGKPKKDFTNWLTSVQSLLRNPAKLGLSVSDLTDTAWTTYTPVITAGVGALGSLSAIAGRYKQIGKTVFVYVDTTIATNGTGAVSINATLPVAVNASSVSILAGREANITGTMLQGVATGSNIVIFTYANGYPGANGYRLIVSGVYEAA